MKKLFLALMLCMVSIMSFGQKTFTSKNFVTETVDEFGDKTGNMKVGIMATGYFSNSATTNSCGQLIISIMKDKSWYSFYEYCGNHSSDDSFNIKFTGTTTHTTVNATYSIPYTFIELCRDNDTIYVKMNETGSYATTTAVFKLFECKKFYKLYIETFGLPKYISYKIIGDGSLCVYKNPVIEIEPNTEIPQIILNKSYDYKGVLCDKSIRLDGRFNNRNYIYISGGNITIDEKKAEMTDKYSHKIDFNWFIKNIQVGSIIREEYRWDSTIYEEIIITEEQYNAIINFFNE